MRHKDLPAEGERKQTKSTSWKGHIRILTEVGVRSGSCGVSPVKLNPFMGELLEEVARFVLWCVVVELALVRLGGVVLAVHPIRMQLPPVGAEHFGDCEKKTVKNVG